MKGSWGKQQGLVWGRIGSVKEHVWRLWGGLGILGRSWEVGGVLERSRVNWGELGPTFLAVGFPLDF